MVRFFCLTVLCFGLFGQLSAQNAKDRQQQLEAQRKSLLKEIEKINGLLFTNTKKKKSALSEVEDLDVKLNTRKKLIRIGNEQANLLTQRIKVNQRSIDQKRKELEALKKDYAEMIQLAYKSKSMENRLLFLFSSDTFLQALKRLNYLKQYTQYRKQQGELIEQKTLTLQDLNTRLTEQKRQKEEVVKENLKAERNLEKEFQMQSDLIKTLKRNEKSLAAQIRAKQKKARALDREIDRLIAEAIKASNKAAGKSSGASFSLSPEAKLIAESFKANKGRLPWPLEKKGIITQRFGRQPHPVVKTAMIQSTGVTIATEPNAKVRAVFEGEVMSILLIKGSNPSVLIRHGNFITVYNNLGKVFVKKGEKVDTKQIIGEVFTNQQTEKTLLKFSVFSNTNAQNPSQWIYKM